MTDSAKRLYRSGTNKMIAGVCAGVAEYLNVDTTLVRVLWVFITLIATWAGISAYIICLLVFPENPEHFEQSEKQKQNPEVAILIVGFILLAVGISFLGFNPWHRFLGFHFVHRFWPLRWYLVWPVVLVLMGFGIVIHAIKTDKAHEEKKDTHHRFYRSRSDKIIGGVCGGMAKYWNIDPKIVRIGYILLTLFSHFVVGVIAYISLLVFMQEEPDEQTGRVVVPDDTSK